MTTEVAPAPSAHRLPMVGSVTTWLGRTRNSIGWPLAMAVIGLALCWPTSTLAPSSGLDPSWSAGVALANHDGLRFGPQVLFTFGPLGFLHSSLLYYATTARLGELFVLVVEFGVLFVLARNAVRAFGRFAGAAAFAILAALAVVPMVGSNLAELAAVLVFLLAIEWLQHPDTSGGRHLRVDLAVPAALGAISGLLFLVKVNTGVIGLAGVLTAAALRQLPGSDPNRRAWQQRLRDGAGAAGAVLGGAVVAAIGLWLVLGQRLGDLPSFLHGSLEVASGYSSAMGFEDPARKLEYVGAAAVVLAVLVLSGWGAWRRASGWQRVAVPAVMVVLVEALLKEGFVRHDAHSLVFFTGLVVVVSALWRWLPWPAGVVTALVAIPLLVPLHVARGLPTALRTGPDRALSDARQLLEPSKSQAIEAADRKALQAHYALPPAVVAILSGHTVDIDPVEATVAWAYPQFEWDPAPVFQTYSAYTPYLDHLDADFLASEKAPDYILRQLYAIDGRNPAWESPEYVVQMMCHYRQAAVIGDWQILQHIPSRCGTPRTLATIKGHMGTVVALPPAPLGSIETFAVTWPTTLSTSALDLVFKSRTYWAEVGPIWYRFVPGTSADPHVVGLPGCLGWGARFAPAQAPTLSFAEGGFDSLGTGATPALPVTVTVQVVPFACGT